MAERIAIRFGDIYVVRINYGVCDDPRPCIVVAAGQNAIDVLALSSQMDLFKRGPHFKLEVTHPDFASTHLKRTCYANSDEKHTVTQVELLKNLGRLSGDLLNEFADWYG